MTSGTSTAAAVSPDSGRHWSAEGAWPVAPGIHRIPLPLPMDGLKAVNVYVVEGDDGLTLVDGGWAIPVARELLERSLKSIGSGLGDIRRFLVTHVHRDHYTMASVLGGEYGASVALGVDEKPALDLLNEWEPGHPMFTPVLARAGAAGIAERWAANAPDSVDLDQWRTPDTWLAGDQTIELPGRTVDAVHTPGHTPGHYVFADRAANLLFAGDHVLPTITPSIGFVVPTPAQPLADFLGSLARVRSLPDLRLLPAHGPVAPSSHARVDELLGHHEHRLDQCLASLRDRRTATAAVVAGDLGWTRHERAYDELDTFNKGMAAFETLAHLDLLVARGLATSTAHAEGDVFAPAG